MTTGVLRLVSISYLLLPNLLFAATWFRLPVSLLMVVGLAYLWIEEFKKSDTSERLSSAELLFLLVFVIVWVFFLGVGGMTSQTRDWLAHNSKFYDLYRNPWPTYFPEAGRYAVHYFGYYLVPAGLSKMVGKFVPELLVGWTILGFGLGISWIYLLIHRNKFLLLIFLFLRGTGLLLITILSRLGMGQVEVPIINPSLRSVFDQSTFVPNQLIVALIACGVLLYDHVVLRKAAPSFFVVTLSFIWGIFPAIALAVFFLFFFFKKWRVEENDIKWFTKEFTVSYLLPGMVFIPTFLYLLSSDNTPVNGPIWSFEPMPAIIIAYVTGILCDLILFYLLSVVIFTKSTEEQGIVRFLLVMLLLLSMFRVGKYNDSFFRASLVFFVGFSVLLLREVHNKWVKGQLSIGFFLNPFVGIVAFLLVLGIFSKAYLLRDNSIVSYFFPEHSHVTHYPYEAYPNIYEALKEGYRDPQGAGQYLGAKDSFYAKYLSRK